MSHHFDDLDGKKTNKEKIKKKWKNEITSIRLATVNVRLRAEAASGSRGRYPVCIVVLGLGLSQRFVEELNIVVAVG